MQRQLLTDVLDLPGTDIDHTYHDLYSGTTSCIDHFALSRDLINVYKHGTAVDQACNPSDHKPVLIDIDCCVSHIATIETQCKTKKKFTAWHKVSENDPCVRLYHNELDKKLSRMTYRDVYVCKNIAWGTIV